MNLRSGFKTCSLQLPEPPIKKTKLDPTPPRPVVDIQEDLINAKDQLLEAQQQHIHELIQTVIMVSDRVVNLRLRFKDICDVRGAEASDFEEYRKACCTVTFRTRT